jgi:hypothetical protein
MRFITDALALCAVALSAAIVTQSARAADVLYIGDAGDNLVKRFNAMTGTLDPAFTKSGLLGPNGMVIDGTA